MSRPARDRVTRASALRAGALPRRTLLACCGQASLAGALLVEEESTAVHKAVETETKRRVQSRMVRERARARMAERVSAKYPARDDFAKAALYIDPGTPLPPDWAYHVAAHEILITSTCYTAVFFVTPDPWHPRDECLLLCAALCGGWIGTPSLLNKVPAGPCRKCKPAAFTKRLVYVSDAFQTQHCRMWLCILEKLAGMPAHKWKFLGTKEAWAAAKAQAVRRGHSAEVLCLVSAQESVHQHSESDHIFGPVAFLKFILQDQDGVGALGIASM